MRRSELRADVLSDAEHLVVGLRTTLHVDEHLVLA